MFLVIFAVTPKHSEIQCGFQPCAIWVPFDPLKIHRNYVVETIMSGVTDALNCSGSAINHLHYSHDLDISRYIDLRLSSLRSGYDRRISWNSLSLVGCRNYWCSSWGLYCVKKILSVLHSINDFSYLYLTGIE